MSDMDQLDKLCQGVRALGPGAELRFKPSEVVSEHWSVMICYGAAIVAYTDFNTLDVVLAEALVKLAGISQRMMVAVRDSQPPPKP